MTQAEFKAKISRPVVTFQVGGARPDDILTSSWLGKIQVAKAGESWPISNGEPMIPICQLNVENLAYKPKALAQIAMICFFIDAHNLPIYAIDAPNGHKWLIRAYSDLDELVKLEKPLVRFPLKPFQLFPAEIQQDYPCWEDCPVEIPDELWDFFDTQCPNKEGIKVGGWPSLIQSEIFGVEEKPPADPEFVLQIDSVQKANLSWGDAGIAYIGKGTKAGCEDEWFFDWQCY